MKRDDATIEWEALEYAHKKRGADWYAALATIAVAGSIASFLLGNIPFAILIIIGAITLAMYSVREPKIVHFEIGKRGIRASDTLYPFNTLELFWIIEEGDEPKLIMKSGKALMPYIILPLGDADTEEIREFLDEYIDEEELYEPLSHKIMEYLGF